MSNRLQYDQLAWQRSDAAGVLGAEYTVAMDVKDAVVHNGNRLIDAATRVGKFASRRRVGLFALGASVCATAAGFLAAKANIDLHVYDTFKQIMITTAELPSEGREIINGKSFTRNSALGGLAAAASAVCGLGYLSSRHNRSRARNLELDPDLPHIPFATPRGDGYYTTTIADYRDKAEEHRRRTVEWEAEATRLAQEHHNNMLGYEMLQTFGGAPRPTTTIYYGNNYHPELTADQVAAIQPRPLPRVPTSIELWDGEVSTSIGNGNGPTVDLITTQAERSPVLQ